MDEKTLLKISIALIVVGLPLFIIAVHIAETDERVVIELSGTVEEVKEKEKLNIVLLKQDNAIAVVDFSKEKIAAGEHIVVQGRLQQYKNKLEFTAEKIEHD